MNSPLTEVKHEHTLEFVKFIREEVRFQHGLLGVRISWLLAAEAFFFTTFAIARGSVKSDELYYFWKFVVPISAGLMALFAIPAIWAAIDRIGEQRKLLREYDVVKILPFGGKWDNFMHWLSLLFALLVPIVLFVAWVVILCLSKQSPAATP